MPRVITRCVARVIRESVPRVIRGMGPYSHVMETLNLNIIVKKEANRSYIARDVQKVN